MYKFGKWIPRDGNHKKDLTRKMHGLNRKIVWYELDKFRIEQASLEIT